MESTFTVDSIMRLFEDREYNEEEFKYLKHQAQRLAYTTNLVQRLVDEYHFQRIMDIGPHFLTYCLKHLVKPEPEIITLGFSNERLFPGKFASQHIQMDLNESELYAKKLCDTRVDLIVFSETIEHLYTSPKIVLSFLSRLLSDMRGPDIIIQTPNAASFHKRLRLLMGHNPYELIRTGTNPGHFREYTMRELENYASETGFKVTFQTYCSYWWNDSFLKRVINIWPAFRPGITAILSRV